MNKYSQYIAEYVYCIIIWNKFIFNSGYGGSTVNRTV